MSAGITQRLVLIGLPAGRSYLFADGTAAAPSISFTSAPTTGFYLSAAGVVGFSSSGQLGLVFGRVGSDGVIQAATSGAAITLGAGANGNATITPSGTGGISSTAKLILKASYADSGNGKIQLDTHTTSAGGIGFGTELVEHRISTGQLGIGRTDAGSFLLSLLSNAAEYGRIAVNNSTGAMTISAVSSGGLIFQSNSTTALTLDSSQNATFAAQVRITNSQTPASAAATGTVGTIAWDTSYIYVCTAANTWRRVAHATW